MKTSRSFKLLLPVIGLIAVALAITSITVSQSFEVKTLVASGICPDMQKGAFFFARLSGINPVEADAEACFLGGTAKVEKKDWEGAVADFTKAIELEPENLPALEACAEARQKNGDSAGAIADYTKLIALQSRKDEFGMITHSYQERGNARLAQGDDDGAIADFTKLIELEPASARTYSLRAQARRNKGDFDGAIADFTKSAALERDGLAEKDLVNAYRDRGDAKRANGDIDGANKDYQKADEIEAKSATPWLFDPSPLSKEQKRYWESQIEIETTFIGHEHDGRDDFPIASRYMMRGYAKESLGDLDGAIADYTKAIQLKPNDPFGYASRGRAMLDCGFFSSALSDFAKLIDLKPEDPEGYRLRGKAEHALADWESAIADYTRAIDLQPQSMGKTVDRRANDYRERGKAEQAKGDLDAAIADYTRSHEIEPHRADDMLASAYMMRSEEKRASGDLDGAKADHTKALELDPITFCPFRWRRFAKDGKLDWDLVDHRTRRPQIKAKTTPTPQPETIQL